MRTLPEFPGSRWLHLLLQQCSDLLRALVSYVKQAWLPLSSSTPLSEKHPDIFPPTQKQVDDSMSQFVASVDRQAVCRLASRYTDGRPCTVVEDKVAYGSFNVCFFVRFDHDESERIVRIPMAPVLPSPPWEKLRSEIATMRYLERKTTIPIPKVFAYGQDDNLVPGQNTPFVIMSVMSGEKLHKDTFIAASTEQRKTMFTDMIDIMAQMRQLEFTSGGSLIPSDSDNEPDGTLGPMYFMTANECSLHTQMQPVLKMPANTGEYVEESLSLLNQNSELPGLELNMHGARLRIFARDSTAGQARAINPTSTTFILTHPDLLPGNVFVDKDFHITGIIDWEFSHTVPLALFTPPSWIIGHDPDMLDRLREQILPPWRETILDEFHEVLVQGKDDRPRWEGLWREWGFDQFTLHDLDEKREPLDLLSPLAHILRDPSLFDEVYFDSIFPVLFPKHKRAPDSMVDVFMARPENASLNRQAKELYQLSQRYVEYLEREGLIPEEDAE